MENSHWPSHASCVQITQEDEKWLAPDMEAVTPTLLRPSGEHF